MEVKLCKSCHCLFEPSSRHANCPKCRSKTDRAVCTCGAEIWGSSARCRKCHNSFGAGNPNWGGGKTKHHKGYIMVSCPDHPRVAGRVSKYVFQHILVMEESLGRFLLPGENVHHKNGVRDDNRPRNLELWLKAQPAGARVVDLVGWAKEILHRYGSLVETSGTAPESSEW